MENNQKIDEEKLKKVTEISQRDAQHYFHCSVNPRKTEK